MAIINGTPGNDILYGSPLSDLIVGYNGDDRLDGREGSDILIGGAGADMLNGGGLGGFSLGEDVAYYTTSGVGVEVRLGEEGQSGFGKGGDAEGDTLIYIVNLVGSDFDDTLVGNEYPNLLDGGDGDDELYGGSGGDELYGGSGGDELYGGENGGRIEEQIARIGGTKIGVDKLYGGDGNDTLFGGEGQDYLYGDAGEDVLVADGHDQDILKGGDGKDTFRFFPSNLGGGTIQDFTDGKDKIDLQAFTDIHSMDDFDEIRSLGDNESGYNVRITIKVPGTDEESGSDYHTVITLSDFDVSNLDNSDFIFMG